MTHSIAESVLYMLRMGEGVLGATLGRGEKQTFAVGAPRRGPVGPLDRKPGQH